MIHLFQSNFLNSSQPLGIVQRPLESSKKQLELIVPTQMVLITENVHRSWKEWQKAELWNMLPWTGQNYTWSHGAQLTPQRHKIMPTSLWLGALQNTEGNIAYHHNKCLLTLPKTVRTVAQSLGYPYRYSELQAHQIICYHFNTHVHDLATFSNLTQSTTSFSSTQAFQGVPRSFLHLLVLNKNVSLDDTTSFVIFFQLEVLWLFLSCFVLVFFLPKLPLISTPEGQLHQGKSISFQDHHSPPPPLPVLQQTPDILSCTDSLSMLVTSLK